jgi:hypothetical protein
MYDEKRRHGRGEEKVFAYRGVWEGARMEEKVLENICIV